jgi:hypothetical protein
LKSQNELIVKIIIDSFGYINENMIEILLEVLTPFENDLYNERNKKTKKKRELRANINKIYCRISKNTSNTILRDKEFIKDKFLNLINENYLYLKQFNSQNSFLIDFLVLRYNFFFILNNTYLKLYFYPPRFY